MYGLCFLAVSIKGRLLVAPAGVDGKRPEEVRVGIEGGERRNTHTLLQKRHRGGAI